MFVSGVTENGFLVSYFILSPARSGLRTPSLPLPGVPARPADLEQLLALRVEDVVDGVHPRRAFANHAWGRRGQRERGHITHEIREQLKWHCIAFLVARDSTACLEKIELSIIMSLITLLMVLRKWSYLYPTTFLRMNVVCPSPHNFRVPYVVKAHDICVP